ncbi:MAG: response regulator [Gammaproteobacteria bacterium]|nr:response regulator [Gammaproteobacteria bacterium]
MSNNDKTHILVVDDSATIRKIISKQLGEEYVAITAANGEEAWHLLQSNDAIALVFLDLHMPVMNGMMLLKQIRESGSNHIAKLPVIMITGHEDSEAAKKASHKMGATDFIGKPFSEVDIISRAKAYANFNRQINSLEKDLTNDPLTGLFSNRGLQEQGDKAVSASRRHKTELSILIMQIKDADEIASQFGEEILQQIIRSVTSNIKSSLRGDDVLAYLSTGQFAVLLTNTNAFKAHIIAMRIQNAIKKLAFKIDDITIEIELAVGLNSSESYGDELTFTELCIQTEKALQASLQHKECKIIRRAELFPEVPYYDISGKSSSDSKFQESDEKAKSSNNNHDIELLCSYIPAMINGEYEKIQLQDIESMIQPLQSYLDYAYSQMKIKLERK